MAKIATKTGLRVAKIRKAAGLTQAELGVRSGLSQRLISNIECGQREGTIDTLIKIARALDVTVTLLTGEKDPAGQPDRGRDAALGDPAAPDGLKALARSDELCAVLGISEEEWAVLKNIAPAYPLPRDAYVAILHVLRISRPHPLG
jgi:transcriptional regulator with XRE-family HTH domain